MGERNRDIFDNARVVVEFVRPARLRRIDGSEICEFKAGDKVWMDGADARKIIQAGDARLFSQRAFVIETTTERVYAVEMLSNRRIVGVCGPLTQQRDLDAYEYSPDLVDWIEKGLRNRAILVLENPDDYFAERDGTGEEWKWDPNPDAPSDQ